MRRKQRGVKEDGSAGALFQSPRERPAAVDDAGLLAGDEPRGVPEGERGVALLGWGPWQDVPLLDAQPDVAHLSEVRGQIAAEDEEARFAPLPQAAHSAVGEDRLWGSLRPEPAQLKVVIPLRFRGRKIPCGGRPGTPIRDCPLRVSGAPDGSAVMTLTREPCDVSFSPERRSARGRRNNGSVHHVIRIPFGRRA